MTGRRSPAFSAPVQTFKNRQSSLCGCGGEAYIEPVGYGFWGQVGPNSTHSRTPCHAAAGAGGRQRSLPTGGAA